MDGLYNFIIVTVLLADYDINRMTYLGGIYTINIDYQIADLKLDQIKTKSYNYYFFGL